MELGFYRTEGGTGWAAYEKKTGRSWRVLASEVPEILRTS
ncbi:hypothetical protein RSWS8N_15944 [Cereibacter sphaeroides WS8N]|nr:hypothetical protein RSWS8N_15944 [Cereibacter sphaeroides WS8N]